MCGGATELKLSIAFAGGSTRTRMGRREARSWQVLAGPGPWPALACPGTFSGRTHIDRPRNEHGCRVDINITIYIRSRARQPRLGMKQAATGCSLLQPAAACSCALHTRTYFPYVHQYIPVIWTAGRRHLVVHCRGRRASRALHRLTMTRSSSCEWQLCTMLYSAAASMALFALSSSSSSSPLMRRLEWRAGDSDRRVVWRFGCVANLQFLSRTCAAIPGVIKTRAQTNAGGLTF